MQMKPRCAWVNHDPLYIDYHDHEWGRPLYDDQKLFELLMLEGMQAGLSWYTILKKRKAFREAFDDFLPEKITTYNEDKISELMKNKAIIRNRRKIEAVIQNARVYQGIQSRGIPFSTYIWSFTNGEPLVFYRKTIDDVPVMTPESELMSKQLKQAGMKFVGPTICYAFMQAAGLVNDHTADCFLSPRPSP
ncbi:DNA-3-methyladenine glycosylase I [Shouchella shacheensis]|uniref:DNA-3-methyladenine glycosylase I n=1 Tax=Shouchella shacheensis TaxID=1649580 RepID=UPI003F591AA4